MKLKRNIKSILYSQKIAPYVFVSPFIIVFLLFFVYPVISTVIMSFQKVVPGQTTFIGLENFKNLLNSDFSKAVSNNLIYTVITIAVLIPVPLILAVLLNSKKMIATNFFRAVLFLPALVSIVVAGFTFRLIFGEMPSALLNSILSNFGIKPIKWLGGPAQWTTFFALLTLCCWRWMGVNIMYYLSGLQSIPADLYESAHIDGAGPLQKLRYITVPLLRPVTIYILTISIYGGLAMFLESFMLFNGNRSPGGAGLTIVGYLYRLGWEQANIGYGSAIGLTLLIITLGINIIMLKYAGLFKKGD
ncbi:carbohydrate ABC transporter permease [Clostridium thermosuccinogenes]|jgi:arabinosaccharide transport system permease protein|uniref:carbohydrate ABC transporter permease n=1 Tax=Clostridium thermosuccinogenes TaxID=84032 RepID=UPI000CCC7A1A|nr:sugar ABC transporter permease [Pseudoclostridium thermosuccinogenes]PNT92049.1 arabinose transporter permease [Pseudoclostridium thermosuccinogenes]